MPRAGMSLCSMENKLYLFGGSGKHAQCFNDLYTFDPKSASWTNCNDFTDLEQIPKKRAGHSMTLVGTKLFIIGGSHSLNYLNDVYELITEPLPEWDFVPTQEKIAKCSETQMPKLNAKKFRVCGHSKESVQKSFYRTSGVWNKCERSL